MLMVPVLVVLQPIHGLSYQEFINQFQVLPAASTSNDDHIEINSTAAFCSKCGTPVAKPEVVIDLKNETIPDLSTPSTNKA